MDNMIANRGNDNNGVNELVSLLENSVNFRSTYEIINTHLEWNGTSEEIEQVCRAAYENSQVFGALTTYVSSLAEDHITAKKFFIRLCEQSEEEYGTDNMPNYTRVLQEQASLISSKYISRAIRMQHERLQATNTGIMHDGNGMEFNAYDGLYHANTVITSMSFLEQGGLFARAFADEHEEFAQTMQASDEIDQRYHIYGDIFFDNSDIPLLANNYSMYGPIMFVYDISILDTCRMVRVTRSNPWGNGGPTWEGLTYEERFYTSSFEPIEAANGRSFVERGLSGFRLNDFGNHTTIYHPDQSILKFRVGNRLYLKSIYIDEHPVDVAISNEVFWIIRNYLDHNNMADVNVQIRKVNNYADNNMELFWTIPEEYHQRYVEGIW